MLKLALWRGFGGDLCEGGAIFFAEKCGFVGSGGGHDMSVLLRARGGYTGGIEASNDCQMMKGGANMHGMITRCSLTNEICPMAWVLLYESPEYVDFAREYCPLGRYEPRANLWCVHCGKLLT